jgi:hypothetical protein
MQISAQADAIRQRLLLLGIQESDLEDAVDWARTSSEHVQQRNKPSNAEKVSEKI